jgi:hypothetical protein
MGGHSSQNALPRHPCPVRSRRHRILVCLLTGLAFLACLLLALDRIPDTALGRSIHNHLHQLADPAAWTP